MNVLAHALAEDPVDELVLAHFGKPAKLFAYDHRFEVTSVSGDFDVIALHALFDALPDEIRIHEKPLMAELVSGTDEREGEQ